MRAPAHEKHLAPGRLRRVRPRTRKCRTATAVCLFQQLLTSLWTSTDIAPEKKRTVLCSRLCVTQENPTHVIVASQLVIVSFCIDVVHVGAVPLQFSGTCELLLAHVARMPPDIHVVRVGAVLL